MEIFNFKLPVKNSWQGPSEGTKIFTPGVYSVYDMMNRFILYSCFLQDIDYAMQFIELKV